jgi:hypothetical protein
MTTVVTTMMVKMPAVVTTMMGRKRREIIPLRVAVAAAVPVWRWKDDG